MGSNETRTGRGLLLLAIGTVLVAGGAAAVFGEPAATWIVAGAFPTAIVLAILAVAWLSVDAAERAACTVIVAPFALFLYAVAASATIRYFPGLGWLLAALGSVALAAGGRSWIAAAPQRRHAERPEGLLGVHEARP